MITMTWHAIDNNNCLIEYVGANILEGSQCVRRDSGSDNLSVLLSSTPQLPDCFRKNLFCYRFSVFLDNSYLCSWELEKFIVYFYFWSYFTIHILTNPWLTLIYSTHRLTLYCIQGTATWSKQNQEGNVKSYYSALNGNHIVYDCKLIKIKPSDRLIKSTGWFIISFKSLSLHWRKLFFSQMFKISTFE